MIPAAEIDGMRATLEASLPDTAVVYKPTRVKDTSGGFTDSWLPQPAVPVRIAPLAGGVGGASAEALIAGRLGTAEAWVVTFPANTDVTTADRVTINGTRGLEIAVVLAPRSWEISRRVVAVELG